MNPFKFLSRRAAIFALAALGVIAAIFVIPFQTGSKAAKTVSQKTLSRDEGLPNYDVRTDKAASEKIAAFRANTGKSAVEVADIRESLVKGENTLRQRVPKLKVEYNEDIGIPEVIAPDVQKGRAVLTPRSSQKHSDILLNFLNQNTELVGTQEQQIGRLKVAADYSDPEGNLSFVELDQEINGVPVFRGGVKAGFTKNGEMFRVINNLAPGLDNAAVSADFGDPSQAVDLAAEFINAERSKRTGRINKGASTDLKVVFGSGDSATTAEKIYFPTEPGVAVPAWRVLIWQPTNAYYVIVNAQTGTMLWRKNITEDQSQPATYSVYTNPNAMINVAHSPFPFVPPGTLPAPNGVQGTAIPRTTVTRIGNEAPYNFNNEGWIPNGGTKTDGNAVQAGLDRDGVDGIDTNSEAVSATRDFTFAYNPLDPNTNTGDAPVPVSQTYPGSAFQQGTITQLFYISNWFHDETYRLGFTEAARNFQNDNFGRGGLGGDRLSAEGQDSSRANNASFFTPADGGRGKMQMYIWTGPNPDIDGNLDADVVIHELTHGLSNRLHGNSSGLQLDLARGMGEGWSDFYAHCLLSDPADPINGIYTVGAYDTYLFGSVGTNNYYYGIRRFPKAVMAFTGPNGKPHNPLTFQDIDSTKIDLSDGAFSPRFVGVADQVHNIGEVWSIALWEIRARMMQRLTPAVGNRQILQLVTDGMKLAPLNPTPLTERDAMIAAAQAGGTAADVADIWAGFALRGFGASAKIDRIGGANYGSGNGFVRVTEAFDLPNVAQAPNLAIVDTIGNHNGVPEPGEQLTLTIPLTNSTGIAATGTTLQIVGGGSASYGTINNGTTVSRTATYTVPATSACGSVITLTLNVTSSLGATSFTRTFAVGSPVTTFSENFDGVTAPAIPAGWTVTTTNAAMTFATSPTGPDTAPNSIFATDVPTTGGSTELTSPAIAVNAPAASVTFRHKYNSESGFDGGVLDISIAGGAFQDIIAAGGTFVQNGYNSILPLTSANTLDERAAWSGDSGGYVTTVVRMPAAANGQSIQLRWRFGADASVAPTGGGWNVDTIQFAGSYACAGVSTAAGVAVSGRVLAPNGRGVLNAVVTLTDQNGMMRTAVNGPRGSYRFDDVEAGRTYVINVASSRFNYSPRTIEVTDNIANLDLVPVQ